jgi:imidazolonepropionase-like amidohydrolase
MASFLFTNAALLDPLKPDLLEDHSVLIEDGLVKEVSDRPLMSAAARTIDLKGKTLMPGLIDLHVHTIAIQYNLPGQVTLPNVFVTLKALPVLQGMLRRGFTTVRDAGGAGLALKQSIEQGLAVGPRLFIACRSLSQTGGHGDIRARYDFQAMDTPCACCIRVGALSRIADGVDEVRRAVRQELQMGADQIKIMASGGVSSPTDPIGALGYSEDEIRAIVTEARARGTYVMAHAYTPESMQRAVRFGVRTIEHGNLVDAETARVMAEHQAYAVPTLVTYEALTAEGAKYGLPPESVVKIASVRDAGLRSLEIFQRAGVKMGFGTDLLGESHRLQSDELTIRAQVLSPAEVIASATTIGAEVLNMTGKLGRLTPGAFADALVVDGNPFKDLACLTGQGERIPFVLKGGQVQFDELAH